MKLKTEPVNFIALADNYNDCLVCMPAEMKYIREAASKLPEIAAIFPNRHVKVLLTSNLDPQAYEFIKRFEIVKPYSYDLTVFYLPKKSFVQKIVGKGLSVCIDLDFGSNFFNSCLCALTRAPLRIGLAKGLGLPYYNLEISGGGTETPAKSKYNNFMGVLSNFNSEGDRIASLEA